MRPKSEIRVAIAMSGGVDSSTAAALLKAEGYSVFGVTMRLPQADEYRESSASCDEAVSEIRDARKTADILGIQHIVADLRKEFREQIIAYFCDEYQQGRTPNPCVLCNPQIKFGRLFEEAHKHGAERLATGHYVNIDYLPGSKRYALRTAENRAKDQSYFLYRLTQEQLARSIFPLAGLTKDAIRQKARAAGLAHVAEKAESQENCFIGDRGYQNFLKAHLPPASQRRGPIVDTQGNVLGEHEGIHLYTIGQRRGLGIALGGPRYVVDIRPDSNTLVIGENHELFTSEFLVHSVNWMSLPGLTEAMECRVKIRYRSIAAPAVIMPGGHSDEVNVIFQQPQRAVTRGQSAVFYDNDTVIGGGIIAR
ncbi:tRNA 2-thiouridine(34) synthase MnmA [candidate division KSB3 bacterium]|uniref:tRNA-specific 2-thiouridylase MnmA n=1 Tax=candidate division KSB3 bacterium TaxID=2044937 RepID=A0A2G6E2I6_9BACT|nr:MAG: tRNA 2-thiouridine(34) synthase MnmA [candidate division KSB3 bacterium]PIE28859.1 MAG: tRNA 2-thiouridine(34) synthase MnmA [candidate division KSB3 bacterium]